MPQQLDLFPRQPRPKPPRRVAVRAASPGLYTAAREVDWALHMVDVHRHQQGAWRTPSSERSGLLAIAWWQAYSWDACRALHDAVREEQRRCLP